MMSVFSDTLLVINSAIINFNVKIVLRRLVKEERVNKVFEDDKEFVWPQYYWSKILSSFSIEALKNKHWNSLIICILKFF